MKISTWQLIKMLWRKEDWYQHYWYQDPNLEAIIHKETGCYFYANLGCMCLHAKPGHNKLPDRWACLRGSLGDLGRMAAFIFIIGFMAGRAQRFARSHSYLPPEKQEEESWR
jgi:hypothetical protein